MARLAKENEDVRQRAQRLESELQAAQALVSKMQATLSNVSNVFKRLTTKPLQARVVPTPSPRKRQRVAAEPTDVGDTGSLLQQLRGTCQLP